MVLRGQSIVAPESDCGCCGGCVTGVVYDISEGPNGVIFDKTVPAGANDWLYGPGFAFSSALSPVTAAGILPAGNWRFTAHIYFGDTLTISFGSIDVVLGYDSAKAWKERHPTLGTPRNTTTSARSIVVDGGDTLWDMPDAGSDAEIDVCLMETDSGWELSVESGSRATTIPLVSHTGRDLVFTSAGSTVVRAMRIVGLSGDCPPCDPCDLWPCALEPPDSPYYYSFDLITELKTPTPPAGAGWTFSSSTNNGKGYHRMTEPRTVVSNVVSVYTRPGDSIARQIKLQLESLGISSLCSGYTLNIDAKIIQTDTIRESYGPYVTTVKTYNMNLGYDGFSESKFDCCGPFDISIEEAPVTPSDVASPIEDYDPSSHDQTITGMIIECQTPP